MNRANEGVKVCLLGSNQIGRALELEEPCLVLMWKNRRQHSQSWIGALRTDQINRVDIQISDCHPLRKLRKIGHLTLREPNLPFPSVHIRQQIRIRPERDYR